MSVLPWICPNPHCEHRNPVWRAQCRVCKTDRKFFVARPRLRRGI